MIRPLVICLWMVHGVRVSGDDKQDSCPHRPSAPTPDWWCYHLHATIGSSIFPLHFLFSVLASLFAVGPLFSRRLLDHERHRSGRQSSRSMRTSCFLFGKKMNSSKKIGHARVVVARAPPDRNNGAIVQRTTARLHLKSRAILFWTIKRTAFSAYLAEAASAVSLTLLLVGFFSALK